jgi:ABC-2 type transport system permease protein
VQATAAPERPEQHVAARTSARSWARAFGDIQAGFLATELWSHLGWQDIKQRYRRSVLGPFWITISQAVIALGLGLLYGVLFNLAFETFLPYVATGLIVWTFMNNCVIEGMDSFISNEGLIKHLPAPLFVYALRTVWRQVIMFGHNMLVYVAIIAIFAPWLADNYSIVTKTGTCQGLPTGANCHPGLDWHVLLAIPGFLLIVINAGWVCMLLGIVSTRFRDLPQLIGSIVQLMFYMTPIVWPIDQVTEVHGHRHGLAGIVMPLINLNPFYHFEQIVRGPLLGQTVFPLNWWAPIGLAVFGWALALVVMRNYRARVSYWV